MHYLTEQTLDYIRRNRLISPGDSVLLSLSAGKDSMAMLHVLHEISGTMGFSMGIFHLNHCMRGDESDLDESLVRERATTLDIPVHIFRHDFKSERTPGTSFEEDARNKRYELLVRLCADHGYGTIAVGHNRTDNIETVLMRIFTGTGVYGLRGMAPSRDNIIRPMLHASPENIYRFLSDKNIPWREDSSNTENNYRRNFLRNRVIPLVMESYPMLKNAVENLGSVADDYERILDSHVFPHESVRLEDSGAVSLPAFKIEEREMFNYSISRIMREKFCCKASLSAMNEMHRKLSRGKTAIILFDNGTCSVSRLMIDGEKRILIGPSRKTRGTETMWEYPFVFPTNGPVEITVHEIGITITASATTFDFFMAMRSDSNYLFIEVPDPRYMLSIRNWRKGDKMRLEFGQKKLKELFIEKKLDRSVKNGVPLLMVGSEIAAIIPGALCSAHNRVAPGYHVLKDSKKVLALYITKKQK